MESGSGAKLLSAAATTKLPLLVCQVGPAKCVANSPWRPSSSYRTAVGATKIHAVPSQR